MNQRYQTTRFFTSVAEFGQLPPDQGAEVAFAGRSNAGKSSALNRLTGQKQLARISKTPGRTQLINFFQVMPATLTDRYLVDLPGYGYAKVPDKIRRHWQRLLEQYLNERQALQGLILLMDVRHPLTPLDQQLLDWCQYRQLPNHILLTKADKLKRGRAARARQQVESAIKYAYSDTSVQLFSALDGTGLDQLQTRLDAWLFD